MNHLSDAVLHLSKAITYKTVGPPNSKSFAPSEFNGFIDFLQMNYPLIHKKLIKTVINQFSLLFHWRGTSKQKPLLLLAHYDVVPIDDKKWTKPPFAGVVEDGRVWGRGTLDDKGSLIAIMEAVERLLMQNFTPERDIYFAFGHDEETMGIEGAQKIAAYLKEKNIAFDCILDEGGIVTDGEMLKVEQNIAVIGVAEKGNCNYEFTFTGEQGHTSAPPRHSSIGKMSAFIHDVECHPRKMRLTAPVEQMLKTIAPYQKLPLRLLMRHPKYFFKLLSIAMSKAKQTNAMLRSTVAFTICQSGNAANVLPASAKLIANVRILQGETPNDIENWFKSFKHDFTLKRLQCDVPTDIANTNSKHYQILNLCIHKFFGNIVVSPYLMIGGTDARYYDALSKNIYRFMPCKLTAEQLDLMHNADENIQIESFIKMIDFYATFIKTYNNNGND